MSPHVSMTRPSRSSSTRIAGVGLYLAVMALLSGSLAACSGGGAQGPTLQRIAIGDGTGTAYAAVAVPLQLTVVGTYSDGTSATLTTGVAWSSSDEAVASVDQSGRVSPWRKGEGLITATHVASGLSAGATLSARDVTVVRAGTSLPDATVDTTVAYFHVTGLQPGALYAPRVSAMSDDVDLAVFSDMSMTASKEECFSDFVGKYDESCIARATESGELWIQVDGEWTDRGAVYSLSIPAAEAHPVTRVLSVPSLPYSGTIAPTIEVVRLTGLAPGARYEFRLSQLSADIDIAVLGDVYGYQRLCSSYDEGTADDACTASVGSSEVYVLISGETSIGGGSYTLGLTPR